MLLLDYARVILRRWWLAVLPLLVIAAITFATTPRITPTTYQVTMSFAGGLPPEPQSKDAYEYDRHYNWLASEYITQGMALVIDKGKFADGVTKRLRQKRLEIKVPVGVIRGEWRSSVMRVFVNWNNAEQCAQIAQAVVDELNENAGAYWSQLEGANVSPFRLMDDIVPVPVAPPLRDRFDLPVRVLLGIVAGVLLAFLAHTLDPVLRDKREIEHVGLNVIGEIPNS
jgi:capsular polysaccharide biosynthesis protein